MNIFNELKRRNVFRAAGLYIVIGWALAQAASLLENALTLPLWFDALVISLLLLGFPLAVIFAWAYEMTPEGLKPTKEISADASIAPVTGKKLDMAILAGLGVLIALLVADRFLDRTDAKVIAIGGQGKHAALADNSIAVLPFTDMSSEQDQQYFSDGISEELLNVLGQVRDLRVAGRTSSFAFKGQNKDLKEIGEILDVGYIVEGSIRKSGNKVRVTAQLVQANDGYRQWSSTYDRNLDDIFAVQDEIARAIVSEMSSALPALATASAQLKPSARADISAFDLFLLAREKMTQEGTRAAYDEAVTLLDQAIATDPDYAPALAWRSYASTMLSDVPGGVGVTPVAESVPVTKAFAERALAADPGSADALFALGSYYGQLVFSEGLDHLDLTIETLKKAIAVRPNFPQAENDLAYFLSQKGEVEEAMAIIADVLARDPGLRDANSIYSSYLRSTGQFDEADAALDKWSRVSPGQSDIDIARVAISSGRGALADAWRQSEKLTGAGVTDNNLDVFRFQTRLNLGDGDWIEANMTDRRKAWGPLLKGDGKRAIALIDADRLARANAATALVIYVPIHVFAGDAAGASAYYDAEIGSPAAAIDAARACNCTMTPLAMALKETGNKDAKGFLAAWKAFLAERRPLYGASSSFMAQSADLAALEGDHAAAKKLYAAAIDAGWRNAGFTDRTYRTFIPRDAEFDALLARMKTLVNTERASLGLAPL